MSHTPNGADKLLIKPTAGARPAAPCCSDESFPRHAPRRPVTRRITSSSTTTRLATTPDRPARRVSQSPERSGPWLSPVGRTSGLRVGIGFVETRQAILREFSPGRPRSDEYVELGANARISVQRPKADTDLVSLRPVPAEQARSAHRAEGFHAPVVRSEDTDQLLTGDEAEMLRVGRVPASRRRRRNACDSASSSSDWPRERVRSPRTERHHKGTSHAKGYQDSALPPCRAEHIKGPGNAAVGWPSDLSPQQEAEA